MGNCHCETCDKQEEGLKFYSAADDEVADRAAMQAPQVLSAKARPSVPPELQKLQGRWQTQFERQAMGEIIGASIIWDQEFNHEKSPIKVLSNGAVEMELMGVLHRATFEEPGCLKWSDGEVWVRVL
ncbi:unnamed protein product [Effrenium voratum]|nr:unnamed protein product [Effrenium voratum]|mmetsp:Transcript_118766/g.281833  ORF Transcript_118766/g.281833 Transcript_118766/m.281833 type:complete len:127 (+) Transcript_118766:64-444(+)